jgi:hypothetical protein
MSFPLLNLLSEHPALLAVVPLGLLGLGGAALLGLMAAPERHRRAVDRLGSGVALNLLVGLLPTFPLVLILLALHHAGIALGRGFCWLLLLAVGAIGIGVCARALGERLLPEDSALRQITVGLLGLLLTALLPPCLPLLGVAAVFGTGAWLRARR